MDKAEKIDGLMLKYAFSSRKYMLDLVNRGVRPSYFAGSAKLVFQVMFDLFSNPAVGQVPTEQGFLEYLENQNVPEVAAQAKQIFAKMSGLQIPDQDFPLALKTLKDRYNVWLAKKHYGALSEAFGNGATLTEVNALFRAAQDELAALNRVEVFDEGILSQDIENMREEYEIVAKNPLGFRGVCTGLSSLDQATGGFGQGELIVVAGQEGTGKSLLMMNWCIGAWLGTNKIGQEIELSGKNILYITLEVPRSNFRRPGTGGYLNRRIVSSVGDLNFGDLRRAALDAEDKAKFHQTLDFISEYEKHYKFYVVDVPRGCTVQDVEAKYTEINEQFRVDMVCVDYIGLLENSAGGTGPDQDWQKQGAIAAGLHEFARVHKVPVLTGCQVNKATGKQGSLDGQAYNSTRLARSGQISQNSNYVFMIGCRDDEHLKSDLPLHIVKARDGQKQTLSFIKKFQCMKVLDSAPTEPANLDKFEDAIKQNPALEHIPSLEDFEPGNSPKLDFGPENTSSDNDYDF
jgi:replicative DNA helicase